ncbi:MAG: type II toxin-antitoxin system HicB family antitoxin [Bacteroidetes bacterium]|nr:type II toxin-antitoxin system HicB family antitoxin [Bacteroidota bacterium]
MKILNYTTIIKQGEDGWYIAIVPDIPGCYTQGKTVAEAIDRIKEAIEVCIEADRDEYMKPSKFIGLQQVEVRI